MYLTYNELPTLINVHCIDKSGKEISVFSANPKRIFGYDEIILSTGCSATTSDFVFRSTIDFEVISINTQFVSTKIVLNSVWFP